MHCCPDDAQPAVHCGGGGGLRGRCIGRASAHGHDSRVPLSCVSPVRSDRRPRVTQGSLALPPEGSSRCHGHRGRGDTRTRRRLRRLGSRTADRGPSRLSALRPCLAVPTLQRGGCAKRSRASGAGHTCSGKLFFINKLYVYLRVEKQSRSAVRRETFHRTCPIPGEHPAIVRGNSLRPCGHSIPQSVISWLN
jgi:hypothetical protein